MIDCSSGIRVMQTFKKLPITMPKRKKKAMTTSRICHRKAGASSKGGGRVSDG